MAKNVGSIYDAVDCTVAVKWSYILPSLNPEVMALRSLNAARCLSDLFDFAL